MISAEEEKMSWLQHYSLFDFGLIAALGLLFIASILGEVED